MRNLFFDRSYREPIESGRKTQTIRCWARRMVNSGEVCKTNIGLVVFIELVEKIELCQLTEADAARDGFESLAALLSRLETRYAGKAAPYYRVTFRNVA